MRRAAAVGLLLCAAGSPATAQEPDLKDLPLIEVVAANPTHTFGVLLSGDGGWASIDKAIAAELRKHGVSVVGINSMKYFWRTRTPDGAATDLGRVIARYRRAWNADTVVLIGYSRGAGAMPFMLNRLPDSVRARVRLLALVGTERTAGFKFRPLDLLNIGSTKGEPLVLPEIERIADIPVICFYGAQEVDTVCPALKPPAVAVKLPGGHHLGGNYGAIGERILRELGARSP